jgi:gamma-glutamyltranspeptidase/glutathione hydrolase
MNNLKKLGAVGVAALTLSNGALAGPATAADLSPAKWDKATRERVEALEAVSFGGAPETQTYSGRGGVVSATLSPIAVQSGLETLAHGGNAADAAVTTALTGVSVALGSYVSYAGIVSFVYYEAKTGKVYTMDAGYNSYRGETDPSSIPTNDLGPLNIGLPKSDAPQERLGRKTLVPGYMAGLESLHDKFGKLKFGDLFAPAIYYAEEGMVLDPHLSGFFTMRSKFLGRTPEGRAFFYKADGTLPTNGDRFRQTETAKTLRGVAKDGARYMYTGPWGQEFVKIIQREGGKVTMADMAAYKPTWSDPLTTDFYGTKVSTVNALGGVQLISGLNMIEAGGLEKGGAYWQDPKTLIGLSRVSAFASAIPNMPPALVEALKAKGVTVSTMTPLTKAEAKAAAPVIFASTTPPTQDKPSHSDSLVVIDKDGNVAAMTHTINAVVWGDTGIVVGGVPIPDSAGFQQAALAAIKPGDRLPNNISPAVAIKDGKPVLAEGQIGSSLIPETFRLMLGVLGQNQDLGEALAKPPLISAFLPAGPGEDELSKAIQIPEGAYDADFLERLKATGAKVAIVPAATARGIRGTVVLARVNPKTGEQETAEGKGVYGRAGAR